MNENLTKYDKVELNMIKRKMKIASRRYCDILNLNSATFSYNAERELLELKPDDMVKKLRSRCIKRMEHVNHNH